MSFKTKNLKMTFLGVTPFLEDKTGTLKPQDIVALSALMTFKGKSVNGLYEEAKEKGQDIDKKVKTIIRKSSLRGHASIATTPAICFTYEASKFLDSMMTGMVFSSSLMASGRRTSTTIDDITYPTSIDEKKDTRELYKKTSEENINFYNLILEKDVEKDDASKALQYGIYGTGIIAYPIESIISFKKEYEREKDWMPEEAGIVINEIEKYLKKMGVDLIYASRDLAARNTLPFPNIFKDPNKPNLIKELILKQDLPKTLTKIIEFNALESASLEKEAGKILKLAKEITSDKKQIKKRWREILAVRQDLMRDFNNILNLKIASSVSWRVWGDKKRHRTVPMTIDSIYYCLNRTRPIFKKYTKKIEAEKLSEKELSIIDRYFTVPSSLKKDKKLLYGYLKRVNTSIDTYFTLIEKYKIPPADAIFVIPRGIRIDLIQSYDLYNLISGYYPLRTCSTAEIQLRNMTRIEMAEIKQLLTKKGFPNIAKLIVTKCHIPGFCLEEKNCPIINGLVKNYDESFHEELKAKLDEDFESKLNNLRGKNVA